MRWLMAALVVAGCGSSQGPARDPDGTGGAEATGGETGSGGAAVSSGGAPASGGATVGSGGAGTGGQTGTGGAPPPVSTLWAVQIKTPTWTCIGEMAMTVFLGDGAGSWNCTEAGCAYRQVYVAAGPCISFAGPAAARFFAGGPVSMQLSTDATHSIGVTGTLGVDRVIGTATFADGAFPFTAVLR